jgi:hypothetical protein
LNERPSLGKTSVAGFIIALEEVPCVFASTAESFLILEGANISALKMMMML